jgi:tRNA(adenine34) deaminase
LGPSRHIVRSSSLTDYDYMGIALETAQRAGPKGEVPVGVVVVSAQGEILSIAHNLRETDQDPTAHAEVLALREAAKATGSWRLEGVTLYVTLEPCPMCAGALVNARVRRLVYGCRDPKAGAVDTLFDLCRDQRLNHRIEVQGGVREEECSHMLRSFFVALRASKRQGIPNTWRGGREVEGA